MSGIIIGIIVVLVGIVLLKSKAADSPSMVITGPGVLKTHDVECKFRVDGAYLGKLSQSRWSDGQDRFSLRLRKLSGAYSGPVQLLYRGGLVAEFEARSGVVAFAAKGMVDDGKPQFEIGEEVRLDFGSQTLTGIVEPD